MARAPRGILLFPVLLGVACTLPGPSTIVGLPPSPTPTPTPIVPPPPAFDAGVYVAYVTQATQTFDGKVPLVQGRDGLARVFLIAKQAGVPAATVRIQLVDTASGTALKTFTIPAPVASIPTTFDEGTFSASWNVAIPGSDLQPGRHLVAAIDPIAGVAGTQQTTLRLPATGSLDVRAVATLPVTIVPIVQSGLAPDVSTTPPRTADSWLDRSRRIHPILVTDLQVASSFNTTIPLTAKSEYPCPGNPSRICDAWADLLGVLRSKQVAEAGESRYYVGAVKVSYSSGVAGIGYIGAKTLLAWDYSSYQKVVAHELGHNFGREHVGCVDPNLGSITGVDPNYPTGPTYDGGHIGVFGWDPLAPGALKAPTAFYDHMSYCGNSATTWTSDYNYRGVMAFLTGRAASVGEAAAAARQPCLLVSGRIEGGTVHLDPVFALDGVPSLPPPGDHALELLDGSGATLASVPFAPAEVAVELEGRTPSRHFAALIPVPPGWSQAGGLRVLAGGQELGRAAPPARAALRPLRSAVTGGRLYLAWDGDAHPRALVRDPRTGEVLAILDGGEALLPAAAGEVEVVLSGAAPGASERLQLR